MADFLWLMYLGFMGTTAIWFLIKGKYKNNITRLDFIISIITWLGLFGYVTGTEMLTPIVWKIVFILGLLRDILFTIFLLIGSLEISGWRKMKKKCLWVPNLVVCFLFFLYIMESFNMLSKTALAVFYLFSRKVY